MRIALGLVALHRKSPTEIPVQGLHHPWLRALRLRGLGAKGLGILEVTSIHHEPKLRTPNAGRIASRAASGTGSMAPLSTLLAQEKRGLN